MCGRLGSYSCSRHCAPSACRTSLSTSTLQRQADTSAPRALLLLVEVAEAVLEGDPEGFGEVGRDGDGEVALAGEGLAFDGIFLGHEGREVAAEPEVFGAVAMVVGEGGGDDGATVGGEGGADGASVA